MTWKGRDKLEHLGPSIYPIIPPTLKFPETLWRSHTLLGTNISPPKEFLTMIFLVPRWDMWSFPGGYSWSLNYFHDGMASSNKQPFIKTFDLVSLFIKHWNGDSRPREIGPKNLKRSVAVRRGNPKGRKTVGSDRDRYRPIPELVHLTKPSNLPGSTTSRWWFQRFFIFTPIWGRFPFWLIFFRWVETTNQTTFLFDSIAHLHDMFFSGWCSFILKMCFLNLF